VTLCKCEPRVGGALELAWKSDEADPVMTLRGAFTEVVLHERAIHTKTMALGSGQTIGSLLEKHEFASPPVFPNPSDGLAIGRDPGFGLSKSHAMVRRPLENHGPIVSDRCHRPDPDSSC
jgi:hypothetical protein